MELHSSVSFTGFHGLSKEPATSMQIQALRARDLPFPRWSHQKLCRITGLGQLLLSSYSCFVRANPTLTLAITSWLCLSAFTFLLQFFLPAQQQQESSLALVPEPLDHDVQLCLSWWEILNHFWIIPLPLRPVCQVLGGCTSHWNHRSQRSCAETHHLTHLALNLWLLTTTRRNSGPPWLFADPRRV